MLERTYRVRQAAELLGVSSWTVWRWLQTGKICGAKIGTCRVIRESELQRLIVDDSRRETAKAETHKERG